MVVGEMAYFLKWGQCGGEGGGGVLYPLPAIYEATGGLWVEIRMLIRND